MNMNTVKSVFKNTTALFIARVGYMMGSILLVSYLSRLLQAEGLGSYSTAMALFGLGELACELGLSNYVPREVAKDLKQTNRYLIHTSILALGSTLAVMVMFWIVTPFVGYSSVTVISVYIISFALLPSVLQVIIGAMFICHEKAELATFTTLFWTIVKILISVYLLYRGLGVVSLVVTFTVINYLSWLNSIWFYVRYIEKPHWEFDWFFFRKMLYDLRTFIVLAVGGSIFTQAEMVILTWLKDDAEVGIYSAAYKLITLWYIIPQSYMGVVFPLLTRSYHESGDKSQIIQEKSIKYLLFAALPLSVGMFAVAQPIITLFYGPGFERAVFILGLIAWHTTLAFINNVFWRILLARDEQHLALRVQIISGVVKVVISFALIPWWGAEGAAWALMCGYVLYTLLHIYYVWRKGTRIPIIRQSWRFALAAAVMGIFAVLLVGRLNLFILIPAAGSIYLVAAVILGAFSADDRALFAQVWQQRIQTKSATEGR